LADARGKDVVIVAGGLGLAPLRPAIYHLLRYRSQYDRLALLYGARTPSDLLYRRRLNEWRKHPDMQFEATVDSSAGDWWGHVGLVTRYIAQLRFNPSNSLAMVCGPEIMMRFTAAELIRLGIPAHMVFVSLERNMQCGTGACGHCQFGPIFVCRDGPVLPYNRIRRWLDVREI
jgi:NAD(P)H-flavin reductase